MYELKVEAMTCGHCAGRITQAVKAVDDEAVLVIDLPAKVVRIDSSQPLTKLTAAMAEAGYPAQVISAG